MKYVLTTEALCKRYKKTNALDDFYMHVPKGAIYGFIGKNGAGKTTLIRMICGLSKPTSGSYTLYGIKNSDKEMEQTRRHMGAVVETPALTLEMTAEENLRQQYRIYGLSSFDGIGKLLELVGLEKAGKKKVKTFSLGMKQRLGIAQAVLNDPKILVLDEPTAGLDPKERVRFRNLIAELGKDSIVILSTHIVSDVEHIADRILMMKDGQFIYDGTPHGIGMDLEEFYLKEFDEEAENA
jgi:ABC-2 type transport system ATP-binding protein